MCVFYCSLSGELKKTPDICRILWTFLRAIKSVLNTVATGCIVSLCITYIVKHVILIYIVIPFSLCRELGLLNH